MQEERHWIDNFADLISGRMHNTLVSLASQIKQQENKMTQNEQTILNAAQNLANYQARLNEGIEALERKIDAIDGVEREDLSEELAALASAVSGIGNVAGRLTPSEPEGGPNDGPVGVGGIPQDTPADPPPAQPISHEEIPVTPLAGSSGPTDAGVPTTATQPGTGAAEVPTTPLAEDAQAEANPELGPSDDGSTSETPVEEEPSGVADALDGAFDLPREEDEDADPSDEGDGDEDADGEPDGNKGFD